MNVVTRIFFGRVGFSWNFKVLQGINPNESFRHCYIHHEDYVMRVLKEFCGIVFEIIIQKSQKRAKSQNLE